MTDKLPNAGKAFVEPAKLTDYLMSLAHRDGHGKAKFFMRFGFSVTEIELLESSLLKHAVTQPVTQVNETEHGIKYVLECTVQSPDGRNPCIRSVWIIDAGGIAPRLVTAFPN